MSARQTRRVHRGAAARSPVVLLLLLLLSERTRHEYDYRVHLEQNCNSLEMYSGDPNAMIGSWVLLEVDAAEQGRPCLK